MADHSYSTRITEHFQLLLRCINPSELLLAELSFTECSGEDIEYIKSASTDTDKNGRLLEALKTKPTDVVDKFVKLLQRYEQSHVADVLRGKADTTMSSQHFDKLRDKKDELCVFLSPSVDLLNFLQSRRVLTLNDADRVRSKQTEREISDELLRVFERKPDSAFNHFIDGLHETGQSHVAWILTGVGDERPIEKSNIKRLNVNRCVLAEELEPIHSGLVDALLSAEAITDTEYQKVKAEKSTYEQSLYLVDIFKRKADRAFRCFVETLKKTGQGHLAKKILGIDVSGTVELNGSVSSEDLPDLEQRMVAQMQMSELLPSLENDCIYAEAQHGSIKIRFSCTSVESVSKLRQLYESGTIDKLLYDSHGRKFCEQGLQSVKVNIPPSEFEVAERCTIMTPEHRNLLQTTADRFASRLVVSDQLLSRLSLCRRRRQAILCQSTAEERARLLFDIVSRQADSAFQQLVDAFRDTGDTEIVEFLQNQHLQPGRSNSQQTIPFTNPNGNVRPSSRPPFSKRNEKLNIQNLKSAADIKKKSRELGIHCLFISKLCTEKTPTFVFLHNSW